MFLCPSADAMNEVAWCYLEGFGTKKDKVSRLFPVVIRDVRPNSAASPLHTITRACLQVSLATRPLPAVQQWRARWLGMGKSPCRTAWGWLVARRL